ncbi:type IX secretion system motor protein PorL/GldL [Riemerella anatipestifer]|uniref:type IX secretion system motor protein PorL/GldL n=1 Tax=Riemerella anatipestifer TaxID=34085 RepID=UPI00129E66A8|nr:gliding motility protein GldL [Riemerella anatipestifer]MRM85185.1 gliding motility protein GldL [Riemerella anatipestifer]
MRLNDKTLNFIYSVGASVVILGAFFKMTHTTFGGLVNPNWILGAGLITEALIFLLYAFNPPAEEAKYAWENVYPELLDANAQPKPRKNNIVEQTQDIKQLEVSLSEKLDKMLKEANLDVQLFERLRTGIDKFSASVDQINQTVDVSSSTQKYNDQLTLAASHLESMNTLYALQLEHGKAQSEYHQKYVSDLQKSVAQSEKFNQELDGLTANLNNLNRVYGGMLNAMKG